jgi:hypothetical protein
MQDNAGALAQEKVEPGDQQYLDQDRRQKPLEAGNAEAGRIGRQRQKKYDCSRYRDYQQVRALGIIGKKEHRPGAGDGRYAQNKQRSGS